MITDVLSKYLEFDPERLKLGIWSGNLSIQDVELKREAIYPLLNGSSLPKQDEKPPLNLKLVKGTVGKMKIRIPWKRLVWGQGDVKLQISDITIAVAYESREETVARNLTPDKENSEQQEEEVQEDEEEKKKKREKKQEWLREAERCQLQGRPLPTKNENLRDSEEEANGTNGQSSGVSSMSALDRWLKSTTETFAWRFVAGLHASIRNVRIVIVLDGVELGTIFHSMDVVPGILGDLTSTELDQLDTEISGEVSTGPSVATPPPDVVPEGQYDDGEHLDKTVKLQGFGVFVRKEDKTSKSPKTLRFSSSVSADDYFLRPAEGNLSISIFDPYPPSKQKKKKTPTTEEEPTTPTTETATVDSVTSSRSRRSKREKRPLLPEESQTETVFATPGSAPESSERPTKQPRAIWKRPERMSSTRQFSISETPTSGNRPKSHTFDLFRGTSSAEHSKASIAKGQLSRGTSIPEHQRKKSIMSGKSIPLLPSEGLSSLQPVTGTAATPPSLDIQLSFGDVKAIFSSRHYQLILTFKSTVERMKNGRPDKSIASSFGDLGPDRKRSVYVDAPTSTVKSIDDPAITSQLPPSSLQPNPRPSVLKKRAQTTGDVDFSSGVTPQRVKLHLQLELPSVRDKNQKIVRSWWQYAYSAVLHEVRKRGTEESTFDRKHLKFDWEKAKYKRKEYVDLYVATHLEPSSVLRSMELKVKLGSKSAEEELLKIEDELSVEQILLYRSIARSLRVRGMKRMPDSVLELQGDEWVKWPLRRSPSPNKATKASALTGSASVLPGSDPLRGDAHETRDVSGLTEVAADCTDINGMRREVNAVRRRIPLTGTLPKQKADLNKKRCNGVEMNLVGQKGSVADKGSQHVKDRVASNKAGPEPQHIDGHVASSKGVLASKEDVASTKIGDNSDVRTVRTFKTTRTSQTNPSTSEKQGDSHNGLRVSASITFSNVEIMVYQEYGNVGDSTDPMRFRLAPSGLSSNDLIDSRTRASVGLQVVTNDASSSDVSDVSILSDDQLFFDQNVDALSLPDGESTGDLPIMSSADFLLFGLPRDVLLHVKVSGLAGKTRGQSGSQQILSLAVDNVSIDGDKDCHLLSLIPTSVDDSARPLDEVHIEKQKKPVKKKTLVSFTELEVSQEQAILVSVVSKEIGSQLQCDLCKAVVTVDLQAAAKIYAFFSNVQVTFPQPLIASTQVDELREYVFQRLAAAKTMWNNSNEGISSAFRLHGLEIAIPGPQEADTISRKAFGSSIDTANLRNLEAKASLSLKLIEYYDGSLFEDILSLSNDYSEVGSRMTNDGPMCDKGWQHRNLRMMNISKIVEGHHPSSSKHSVRPQTEEARFLWT